MRHYLVLWSVFAIEGGKLEMRRQNLVNFYRQNLVKGNSCTWGLLRTAGPPEASSVCRALQRVTRPSPSMLCSSPNQRQNLQSRPTYHHQSFQLNQRMLSNPQQMDPTRPSNELIFSNLIGGFLAITYSQLQYLYIQTIFWTDLIYFSQFSNA